MIRDDLEAAFKAKLVTAPAPNAVVRFDLGVDGVIVLDGKSSPPNVAPAGPKPDTTISVSASDLQEMMAGTLKPMEAYSMGRLDVSGDMGVAMQLGSLLG